MPKKYRIIEHTYESSIDGKLKHYYEVQSRDPWTFWWNTEEHPIPCIDEMEFTSIFHTLDEAKKYIKGQQVLDQEEKERKKIPKRIIYP